MVFNGLNTHIGSPLWIRGWKVEQKAEISAHQLLFAVTAKWFLVPY